MATHSSVLARESPWTEEPGGLGLERVGHNREPTSSSCVLCVCAQLLPDPGIKRASPTLAGGLFQHCDAWEAPLLAASDLKDHPALWPLRPLGRQDPLSLSPSQNLSPFLLGPEFGGWRRGGVGRVLHSMSPC